jgi:sialate O-acetylesterase
LGFYGDVLKDIESKNSSDSLTIDKKSAVPQLPASVFNAMIHPLIPFALKGFLWYQGEQNWNTPYRYRYQLPAFINDLRIRWRQGYLPFYFVQLPNSGKKPVNPTVEDFWSVLRESQMLALRVPNTGMVVSIDIGDGDLHPKNKKPFGERLAALALHHIYKNNITSEGPLLNEVRVNGDTIVVSFHHTGMGLVFNSDSAKGFAIAGDDRRFYWANASISNNTVKVYSPWVKNPKAVRYAWGENPDFSLFNREGWPASPFRTDDWQLREDGRW